MNRSYLLDKDFLKELDKHNNRVIYARIIALDYDELPIEQIEGVVTAGNISIDGKSAVRRTCSLTVMTDDMNINDVYWGFKTKVKIEIGLENTIDTQYPDICWFPQGVYVLNNFTTQLGVNNYTINLSGKDKMCLLNGDLGGVFNAETNFSVLDEVIIDKDNNLVIQHIYQPIKSIIWDMIHHYALEPFSNIILRDLDKSALNMLDNISGLDIYILVDKNNNDEYGDIFWNGSDTVVEGKYHYIDGNPIDEGNQYVFPSDFIFKTLVDEDNLWNVTPASPTEIYDNDNNVYNVIKIEPGGAIGYEDTELIFPKDKDLIASVGSTVTSILDEIVSFMGDYEYFYNLDGLFVFLAKPIYINTSWNNITAYDTNDELFVMPSELVSKVLYGFEGSDTVTALSNQPKINNIKNDFTVWGEKNNNGIKIPIHARYAIDEKPKIYVSFPKEEKVYDEEGKELGLNKISSIIYISNNDVKSIALEIQNSVAEVLSEDYIGEVKILERDWRELIYQMALDYLAHNHDEDFEYQLRVLNTMPNGISLFPRGKTGYELYYHDIQGFWRLLYNPDAEENEEGNFVYAPNGDPTVAQVYNHNEDANNYWNVNVHTYPHNLLFWFDFYTGEGIDKFSVHTIGSRPKAVNETNVKSIIYLDVPDIIFFKDGEDIEAYKARPDHLTGYSLKLADVSNITRISTRGIAAHDKIDTMLFNNTYYNASISITSVPVYYLEPNGICYVKDEKSNIDGYYIMEKITIPLTYNGTMAINAIELPQRIY